MQPVMQQHLEAIKLRFYAKATRRPGVRLQAARQLHLRASKLLAFNKAACRLSGRLPEFKLR